MRNIWKRTKTAATPRTAKIKKDLVFWPSERIIVIKMRPRIKVIMKKERVSQSKKGTSLKQRKIKGLGNPWFKKLLSEVDKAGGSVLATRMPYDLMRKRTKRMQVVERRRNTKTMETKNKRVRSQLMKASAWSIKKATWKAKETRIPAKI